MHDQEALQSNSATPPVASARMPELIGQLMLKPTDTSPDASQPLTTEYLQQLQADAGVVRLSYIRPMSMGMHVLGLEPAQERDAAVALAERLTARPDVEYAEPDFPRRRR